MNVSPSGRAPRWRIWIWVLAALLLVAAAGYYWLARPTKQPQPPVTLRPEPAEATAEQVRKLCGACHAYPPPETLPRSAWRKEVKQGYDFLHDQPALGDDIPPLEAVVRYYERRAPQSLVVSPSSAPSSAPQIHFEPQAFTAPDRSAPPGITHVALVNLFGGSRPEVLACDAQGNELLLLQALSPESTWRVLAKGFCCARAEVVDLNGDGRNDILLASLGSFLATDDRVGAVVWLRGSSEGTFTPVTLLDGVGRVADVRAADFDGDGDLDLIAAVFGWRDVGELLYLENRTTDWSQPNFGRRILDQRHGTTHVPPADLDRDGDVDFVALMTQEHETAVAFVNEGNGEFHREVVFTATHPTFGCNGLELADLDGDGDLDGVLTNGDALDAPYLLKPYHGVMWLENRGKFPWTPHRLAELPGASGATAADVDGDGDLDVVAASFLPERYFPARNESRPDALIWLEQSSPGRFERHTLRSSECDHPSCAVGDVNGDHQVDLVLGHFVLGKRQGDTVTVWYNRPASP